MSGLTEDEREALRGLGQGQVPAVVERIVQQRVDAALAPIEVRERAAAAGLEGNATPYRKGYLAGLRSAIRDGRGLHHTTTEGDE